jgi:hypothetical protein
MMTKFLASWGLAVTFFYFGGWAFQLGGWPPTFVSSSSGFILNGNGILFRFNADWYGMYVTARFFSSPVIQWIMFFAGWSLLFAPFSDSSDDNNKPGTEKQDVNSDHKK